MFIRKASLILILLFIISCNTKDMSYTKEDILKELDSNGGEENPYKFFLDLEAPYTTVSSNKIHLYADKSRWAIVFEINGFEKDICIGKSHFYFGNCLHNLDRAGLNDRYICNSKYFLLCPENEILQIFKDYYQVSSFAKTIKIRNKEFVIEHDIEVYKKNNIPWQKYDTTKMEIDVTSMVRMLNFQYPEVFNSIDEELITCLPSDLPKLMTIEEWYHEDCYNVFPLYGEPKPKPSTIETFQLIAEVLATKDSTRFKPTLKPNSHWRNWNSGDL